MKYTIELQGWECHLQAKSIDEEQVGLCEDMDDVWDIDEEFLSGEGDYEVSALFYNDPLYVNVFDENNNEVLSLEYNDIQNLSELVEDDNEDDG